MLTRKWFFARGDAGIARLYQLGSQATKQRKANHSDDEESEV
jgi:hypothetical protein